MRDKIKESKGSLDEIEDKYDKSRSVMLETIKRFGDVLSANSNYFCYLILFIFVLFFFLYKIT
jgi:hypothetical protein